MLSNSEDRVVDEKTSDSSYLSLNPRCCPLKDQQHSSLVSSHDKTIDLMPIFVLLKCAETKSWQYKVQAFPLNKIEKMRLTIFGE